MLTIARLIVLGSLAAFVSAATAQQRTAFVQGPVISNEYVRVAKITFPTGGAFTIPVSPDAHILIATGNTRLDEIANGASPQPLENRVQMFEASRSYALANNSTEPFTGLLLDLQKDPGKISCTETKNCPWSIRPMDPLPVILSEHVTVFSISLPWTPERDSLIVPESDISTGGQHYSAGNPFWMLSPTELAPFGASAPAAPPVNVLTTGGLGKPEYFLEVAFYDKPFCFCKRVH